MVDADVPRLENLLLFSLTWHMAHTSSSNNMSRDRRKSAIKLSYDSISGQATHSKF